MPQYAVLIYAEDSAHSPDATSDELAEPDGHGRNPAASRSLLAAWAFTPRALARSIRADGVTNGPFVDAATVVAGVYFLDAPNEKFALAIAATNPAIKGAGRVEVRLVHSGGTIE